MQILLTRRPIFDADDRVIAYALRYRDAGSLEVPDDRVVLDAFLGHGIDDLAGGRRVLLPVSHDLVRRDALPPLDHARVTLRMDAPASTDAPLVEACERLAAQGASFALDGVPGDHRDGAGAALLRMASMVSIDVLVTPIVAVLDAIEAAPPRARLLAHSIPGRPAREGCARLGFTLFEGTDAARVETVAGRDVPIDHLRTFRLLRDLRDPTVTDTEIEERFRTDLALTYKLLRIANSAAISRGGIHSVAHAVRLLGREALGRWLSLLLLSSVAEHGPGQRELAQTALVRGRTCELLATASGVPRAAGSLFVVGALSLLDALLGIPMEALVARMELAEDARRALLGREDYFGAVLALVEAHERGDWETVGALGAELGVEPRVVAGAWRAALGWADEQMA